VQQEWEPLVQGGMAVPAGFLGQDASQVALTGAGQAGDEDVVMMLRGSPSLYS